MVKKSDLTNISLYQLLHLYEYSNILIWPWMTVSYFIFHVLSHCVEINKLS